MPAAIPRGWTFSNRPALALQPLVALAGMDGVARVLTSVVVYAVNNAPNAPFDVVAQLEGVFDLANGNPLFEIADPGTAPFTLASGSWSGEIVVPASWALNASTNAGVPNWVQTIVIQGYDL